MAQDLEALLERKKKLQEQMDEVEEKINGLKQERVQELMAELKELGVSVGKKAGRTSTGTRVKADVPCSVCEFKTEPLHDARAHRSQGKSKKPFTTEELKERGMKKA